MNESDPLERALTEVSDGAEAMLRAITPASLNLIVEIVENRVQQNMRERRTLLIRWLIGIAVPVIGGLGVGVYNNRVDLDAEVRRVESGIKAVTNDTHTTPTTASESESVQLLATTRRIPAGSSTGVAFAVDTTGLYLIDVVSEDEDLFDPYIELYHVQESAQESAGSDDDGGEGLNSRLVLRLVPGDYHLEVSGLFGEAGDVRITIMRIGNF